MSATTTKRTRGGAEGMFRQCVMHDGDEATYREYVAWIPVEKVKIGATLTIDSVPGQWKIVSAGDARPASIVSAYHDHARQGISDGHGPSTPMRDAQERYERDWARGRK